MNRAAWQAGGAYWALRAWGWLVTNVVIDLLRKVSAR